MHQDSVFVLTRHGKVVGLNDDKEAVTRWLAANEEEDAYAGNIMLSCKAEPWTIGHSYDDIENAHDLHNAELEAIAMEDRLKHMSPEARAIMNSRIRP